MLRTRVVGAWRRLVARSHVVRERVALLIGKMLNAVFVGWQRYARRRVAARFAGEEVSQLRKERRTSQAEERLKAWGTGFSSIKEVDNSWSRFGFVPKPSNAVGDAAGPSGAAAAGRDEVVEI